MSDATSPRYADVALPVPILRTFTYAVPEQFIASVRPGMRVLVPFGPRSQTGVVVALKTASDVKGIRPIRDVLDTTPSYSEEMLRLTRWIANYYFTSWGDVLRTAAPHGLAIESSVIVRLLDAGKSAETAGLGRMQTAVLEELRKQSPIPFSTLKKRLSTSTLASTLNTLAERSLVLVEDTLKRPKASIRTIATVQLSEEGRKNASELTKRTRIAYEQIAACMRSGAEWRTVADLSEESGISQQTILTLVKKKVMEKGTREVIRDPFAGPVMPPMAITPNAHQQTAIDAVMHTVQKGTFATFLLHGITGSGKTQVYIEALRAARQQGKTGIVMVPEISLTPQTVRRFRSHFGDDVVVMHSQLSAGERYDAWRRVHERKASIVIGPRSAVFAPLKNIGLIVVDEEHESSYKQYEGSPRYHARDVAIVRGRENNAAVILGSATPSVESMWNASQGKYTLLELPERVDDAKLPIVRLVDMVAERKKHFEKIRDRVRSTGVSFPKRLPPNSLSEVLINEIRVRLNRSEGVILLHNRRGFAHVLECSECGHVETCKNCDVSMTYHQKTRDLHCHYCGARRVLAALCPSCLVGTLTQSSYGTQQVYDELMEACPGAKVIRMDRDSTSRKGTFERYLRSFESGETDILLGTQMVAKGLDFPRVTLVGVISAETQLYLPDFRAAERTFQLLTQVAGRAGRGKKEGEVVIQTVNPQHRTLIHAVTHDYKSFYKEEISVRKEVSYPPLFRLVLVECSGSQEPALEQTAARVAALIKERNVHRTSEILGPAEPAIPKLRNLFRRHILIKNDRTKDPGARDLRFLVEPLVSEGVVVKDAKGIRITVDVDPQTFM